MQRSGKIITAIYCVILSGLLINDNFIQFIMHFYYQIKIDIRLHQFRREESLFLLNI